MTDIQPSDPQPVTDHLPIIDEESRTFWESLADNQFMLKWCLSCEKPHFYPRTYCPFCWGETEWRPASGKATVYATTVIRAMGAEPFRQRVPYNVSVVQLEEGPLMLTNVVGIDPTEVKIGLPVELQATPEAHVWLPLFTPASPLPSS